MCIERRLLQFIADREPVRWIYGLWTACQAFPDCPVLALTRVRGDAGSTFRVTRQRVVSNIEHAAYERLVFARALGSDIAAFCKTALQLDAGALFKKLADRGAVLVLVFGSYGGRGIASIVPFTT